MCDLECNACNMDIRNAASVALRKLLWYSHLQIGCLHKTHFMVKIWKLKHQRFQNSKMYVKGFQFPTSVLVNICI